MFNVKNIFKLKVIEDENYSANEKGKNDAMRKPCPYATKTQQHDDEAFSSMKDFLVYTQQASQQPKATTDRAGVLIFN